MQVKLQVELETRVHGAWPSHLSLIRSGHRSLEDGWKMLCLCKMDGKFVSTGWMEMCLYKMHGKSVSKRWMEIWKAGKGETAGKALVKQVLAKCCAERVHQKIRTF